MIIQPPYSIDVLQNTIISHMISQAFALDEMDYLDINQSFIHKLLPTLARIVKNSLLYETELSKIYETDEFMTQVCIKFETVIPNSSDEDLYEYLWLLRVLLMHQISNKHLALSLITKHLDFSNLNNDNVQHALVIVYM